MEKQKGKKLIPRLQKLYLEDTKENPMHIELNGHRITGIQSYAIHRESCNPLIQLTLNLICEIGDSEIIMGEK